MLAKMIVMRALGLNGQYSSIPFIDGTLTVGVCCPANS